jgi:hypothetical protein
MKGRLQIQGEKALTTYNQSFKGQKMIPHRGMAGTGLGIGEHFLKYNIISTSHLICYETSLRNFTKNIKSLL